MRISIVTISFNQAKFISACIESVLAQDYDDIEYIVVDAGSTDGSREIINQYSSKLARVIFEPDKGPADGLNKGFGCATGDIFYYINADDVLLPGAIHHAVEYFTRRPDADILIGNGYQLDKSGEVVRKIFSTKWSLTRYVYGTSNAVQQATFFRRVAFVRAGGFNIENRTCWDGELLVDMALCGARFKQSKIFFGGFRIHDASITGSGRLLQPYITDIDRIKKKILGRSRTKADSLLSILFRIEKIVRQPSVTLYNLNRRFIVRRVSSTHCGL